MKKSLLFFVFLFSVNGFGQDNFVIDSLSTPFNPKGKYYNIDVRGTFLPYFIGNSGGVSMALGFDVGIGKRQSIGLEAAYFFEGGAHDDLADNDGVVHQDNANRYGSNNRAIFLHYRYYLGLQKFRSYGWTWYVSPFARYGKIERYQDQNFPGNDYTVEAEVQKSAGMVVGCIINSGIDNLGFDINVGGFYKTRDITTDYIEQFGGDIVKSKKSNIGLRIGVSINYWFDL